jgi:hypothetical protein
MDQLELEVEEAIAYLSSLWNNIPAHLVTYFAGGGGLVAKICFADGVCWADKMFKGFTRIRGAIYGLTIMYIVHAYCPSIPLPKSKAYFEQRLVHHSTEWIEGMTLFERVYQVGSNYSKETSFSMPRKVASSLAEFMYNLTNCPIPVDTSEIPLDN